MCMLQERLIKKLNKRHNQKLKIMKEKGVSTFTEKGNYFIKGRTLYKEDYINGYKASTKVKTFTKDSFPKLIEELVSDIFNTMTHYVGGILMFIESPSEETYQVIVQSQKDVNQFNYDNRNNDRYAIAWGRI